MIELFKTLAFSIFPSLATVFITIAYLPQVYKTFKTKSVGDLSLGFWVLINLFLVCMWTNSLASLIYDGRVGYFLTESVNWLFAIIVLVQILVYRKKDKKSKESQG